MSRKVTHGPHTYRHSARIRVYNFWLEGARSLRAIQYRIATCCDHHPATRLVPVRLSGTRDKHHVVLLRSDILGRLPLKAAQPRLLLHTLGMAALVDDCKQLAVI